MYSEINNEFIDWDLNYKKLTKLVALTEISSNFIFVYFDDNKN